MDSDADGLTDAEERRLGTDPYDPDTDHDGLGDYQEVYVYGTDPLNPDTNNNGIPDGDEVKMGRNPRGKGSLKDFLLANQDNDFRPHILHPKRLVFYSLSAVFLKIFLVAVIFLFPLSAWLTPDILSEESRKVLTLTNQYRVEQGLPELQENESLRLSAVKKCQDMLIEQYFSHVGPGGRAVSDWLKQVGYQYRVAGENLALGFSRAENLVKAWKESDSHRRNLLDPDYEEIGVAIASGKYQGRETTFATQHFGTQVVRQESRVDDPEEEVVEEEEEQEKDREETSFLEEDQDVAGQTEPRTETSDPPSGTESETATEQEPYSEQEEIVTEESTELPNPSFLVYAPSLTNKTPVEVRVMAPEAEKIRVFSGDKELKSVELGFFKNVVLEIEPPEGKNQLWVEATRGDESTFSDVKKIELDLTPPKIDHSTTFITVDEPSGRDEVVVRAEASLSPDTQAAEIRFGDHSLTLEDTQDDLWQGRGVFSKEEKKEIFDPVVPASLVATDQAGNTSKEGIAWENVQALNTSLFDQYFYLKAHPSQYLKPLFDISSIYYSFLLSLALLVLAINIILDMRRQKGHVVISTLVFAALLILLIIV